MYLVSRIRASSCEPLEFACLTTMKHLMHCCTLLLTRHTSKYDKKQLTIMAQTVVCIVPRVSEWLFQFCAVNKDTLVIPHGSDVQN